LLQRRTPTKRQLKRHRQSARRRCFGLELGLVRIHRAPSPTEFAEGATANATVQLNSSQQMRRRIMSLYAITFLGTTPIGAPLIGAIVSLNNPRVGIQVGSGVALLTGIWLALSLRQDERSTQVLQMA
jgi:hypothetical protein